MGWESAKLRTDVWGCWGKGVGSWGPWSASLAHQPLVASKAMPVSSEHVSLHVHNMCA